MLSVGIRDSVDDGRDGPKTQTGIETCVDHIDTEDGTGRRDGPKTQTGIETLRH